MRIIANQPLRGERMSECNGTWRQRALAYVGVSAMLLSGCASIGPYRDFADAGVAYTRATAELLGATQNISIDASSEVLLREERTLEEQRESDKLDQDKVTSILETAYKSANASDRVVVELTRRGIRHVNLMNRYFANMSELANTRHQEGLSESLSSLGENLNKVGNELRGSALMEDPSILGSLGEVIVNARIRSALREELRLRKDLINQELKTQEEILAQIADLVSTELSRVVMETEERVVRTPLLEAGTLPAREVEKWKDTRRYVLTAETTIEQLDIAQRAAKSYREAFEKLVTGQESPSFETVISDINTYLDVVEALLSE